MLSLLHARKLLNTHGYESFVEQVQGMFDTETSKGKFAGRKGVIALVKKIKEEDVYREL